MAVQILTIVGESLQTLLDNANTALAALLDRAITRVEFQLAETPRGVGREYRLVLSHVTAASPVSSAFYAAGYESSTPQGLNTSLTALIATLPANFISAAYVAQIISNGRYIKHCAGIIFTTTDTTQGPLNWQAGGGSSGGGGGGDHSTLTSRDLINQHPAKAVSMDAATVLANGANVVDMVTAVGWRGCTWHVEMDDGSSTIRASTVRAVVDGSSAVTAQEYGVVLAGAATLPTIDVTYSAGAFVLTITAPGTGWTARVRRDSLF